jgi:magnesium transporter
VMGPAFVLSFQERPDDALEVLRARLGQPDSLTRRSGSDYLLYALLDVLVDGYFPVVARIGEALEGLEEKALDNPGPEFLRELQLLRTDLLSVRHDVWPQREALHGLQREGAGPISEPVRVYLRDCHDHCVQVAEVVDVHRELAAGLQSLYLTAVANRTNDVMKVLTIMSTIFIPLTFLAGIYGMNFEHMPELQWAWTYPVLLLLMLAIAGAMLVYFRRRGWIGRGQR